MAATKPNLDIIRDVFPCFSDKPIDSICNFWKSNQEGVGNICPMANLGGHSYQASYLLLISQDLLPIFEGFKEHTLVIDFRRLIEEEQNITATSCFDISSILESLINSINDIYIKSGNYNDLIEIYQRKSIDLVNLSEKLTALFEEIHKAPDTAPRSDERIKIMNLYLEIYNLIKGIIENLNKLVPKLENYIKDIRERELGNVASRLKKPRNGVISSKKNCEELHSELVKLTDKSPI